jgi:16S rRNA (guanine966-N2)-methyltransferase
MRIIAGKYRSRQLHSLKGLPLRPTSDRLRESLFDVLGQLVDGSRFIDAFAGTGAVGIEALSRGANEVIFLENQPKAVALIKKNLESLQVNHGIRVLPVDVLQGLQSLAKENRPAPELEAQQEILFLDPPYDHAAAYERVLSFLGSATLLSENSLVIAEHRRKFELPEVVEKLQRVRVLRQGDAALTFYRLRKNSPAGEQVSQ